jgi:quinol-cytochrome oxidoreductase complex cytochrome b subunit
MGHDRGNPDDTGLATRIWSSVFPSRFRVDGDRERRQAVREWLALHARPVRVRESTLPFTHTFGLGGMSLVLVILLMGTGVLLMLVYEPTPATAYRSIEGLEQDYLFGGLVRNVHHWSANLLVAVALLHMLRTLVTGGFHGLRRFNWVIGLSLLVGVLAANFSGYLLPWDQLSYWAVTICTGMLEYIPLAGPWLQGVMRGGREVGASTLVMYYAFHTTVIPVTVLLFMAFHFWRVRKAGGVVDPEPAGPEGDEQPAYVSTLPHLLMRELAVGLTLVAAVLVFSVLVDAPLGAPANPGMSPNPAKAPWYFLGFQELQLHFDPLFSILIVPILGALFFMAIPYLRYSPELSGPWFLSRTGRKTAMIAAMAGSAATAVMVVVDEMWLHTGSGSGSPFLLRGLLPLAIFLAGLAGFRQYLVRRYSPAGAEQVQAIAILVLSCLVTLTVIGVFFRGAGMALVWPWQT